MLQEQNKMRVVQDPQSHEISLVVRPGTGAADLAYEAAYAALRQEDARGVLDEDTTWAVRTPLQRLVVANHKARTHHPNATERFEIRGEAAAAVIEGLGALALEGDSAHGTGNEYDRTTTLETAERAGEVLGDILDQSHELARARHYTQRITGTIYE